MHVKKISLNSFRNYENLELELSPGINIIYGNNAQGKTNILESIYYCATARSHRTNYDKELILWGKESSHIRLELFKKRDEVIDIHLRKNGKKGVAINRIPIHKLNELYGTINVILFSPEDLSLIKKGPSERRKFLDIEISQIDKVYLYHLQQYHKVLKQRNNLLKIANKGHLDQTMLDVWDEQLIGFGIKIIEKRCKFIERMNCYIKPIHYQITNDREEIHLSYEDSVKNQDFMQLLKKNLPRDIKTGNTSIGPHRDDLFFSINGIDLRTYGSQGQHRTAALSLKLGEISLIQDEINDTPVLLLDDVLSELDEVRQQHLIKTLKNIQTIITCTGVEDFIRKGIEADQLIHVSSGKASVSPK